MSEPLLTLSDNSSYHSSSDEEFDPTAAAAAATAAAAAAADTTSSSADEEEEVDTVPVALPPASARGNRKRKRPARARKTDSLDSGDEATIAAGSRAKRRRSEEGDADEEGDSDGDDEGIVLSDGDDEGGEGGLVLTRAQRRAGLGLKERRPLARVDGATADVDAIWARLREAPVASAEAREALLRGQTGEETGIGAGTAAGTGRDEAGMPASAGTDADTVTIKRSYVFAGEVVTEARVVPRASAEAKLYLAEQERAAQEAAAATGTTANGKANAKGKAKAKGKHGKHNTASTTAETPADTEAGAEANAQAQVQADAGTKADGHGDLKAKTPRRRPLRRPSRFEPNPAAEVRGIPPSAQLTWARRRALLDPSSSSSSSSILPIATTIATTNSTTSSAPANPSSSEPSTSTGTGVGASADAGVGVASAPAQKLNTVAKSRLDWAGYVDKAGLAHELDEHSRAKEGYLGRMEFLGRVERRRDEGVRGGG